MNLHYDTLCMCLYVCKLRMYEMRIGMYVMSVCYVIYVVYVCMYAMCCCGMYVFFLRFDCM